MTKRSSNPNPEYTYKNPGNYSVKLIITTPGSKDSTTKTISVVSSISEEFLNRNFRIFPNPFENQIIFEYSGSGNEKMILKIFSSNGKSVYNAPLSGQANFVDIQHFSSGLYHYIITGKKGIVLGKGRLVKAE